MSVIKRLLARRDSAPRDERTQADPVLHFGMHRGKRMSEIPRDYLAWLADQEGYANGKDFRRVCQAARRIVDGRFPSG